MEIGVETEEEIEVEIEVETEVETESGQGAGAEEVGVRREAGVGGALLRMSGVAEEVVDLATVSS